VVILRRLWETAGRCCNARRPCRRRRARQAIDHAAWRAGVTGRSQRIRADEGFWRIEQVAEGSGT
jgi:hypothetical protein